MLQSFICTNCELRQTLDEILTGTPFATISGIFSAQMVSSPALSAEPRDDVEEW